MSHLSKLTTKLNNIRYIKQAMDNLGIKYVEGNNLKTSGNYNQVDNVDILIKSWNNQNYNEAFGLQKNTKDNTYSIVGDFYGAKMPNSKALTDNILSSTLLSHSKLYECMDKSKTLGFSIEEQKETETHLLLTAGRWN